MAHLEKTAIIGAFGAHVVQNAITKKMFTKKTGSTLAKSISGKTGPIDSMKQGAMNVVSPEMGILRGELAHSVKKFNGASRGERAAALSMMNGNFDKVLKSRTFAKSKRLQSMVKDMNITAAQAAVKHNPKFSLKGHENIYKSHPIGQLVSGMTAPLKKINPKDATSKNLISDISEGVGNLGVGIVDPLVAGSNIAKRYGGLAHDGKGAVARKMHSLKNKISNKFISNPTKEVAKDGIHNIVRGNIKKNVVDYTMNPVTGGLRDIGNKMGLETHKLLVQNGVAPTLLKKISK